MLKNNLHIAFFATLLMSFYSLNSFALSEESQQEESFNGSIQKLAGGVGNIPVYSHIYGANFMNEQERCQYLLKLDSLQTKAERDDYRADHHKKIDMRRKQEGG